MPSQKFSRRAALVGALLLLSASCSSLQRTSRIQPLQALDEAGSVHVAVLTVEDWDAVAPSLGPGFPISGDSALAQVMPQTSTEVERFLGALGAQLALGLPQSTTTTTSTQATSQGQPATDTTQTTRQSGPGQAPSSTAQSPAGARTAQGLPGSDILGTTLGIDPMLRHTAAAALYQEVTLLNRYVRAAARRSGYRAYIVRLQLSLIPYRRDIAYDSYTDIAFFTLQGADDTGRYYETLASEVGKSTRETGGLRQPVVIPLLVTDNLEGSRTSSTAESVQQLALVVGALQRNVQANASVQSLRDELRSITGTALNSLQTIARQSDNSIRVRIGAPKSPVEPDAFLMVPNSHNITLLIMAPSDWIALQELETPQRSSPHGAAFPGATIRVVAGHTLRHTVTGAEIGAPRESLGKKFVSIYNGFFGDVYPFKASRMPSFKTVDQAFRTEAARKRDCPGYDPIRFKSRESAEDDAKKMIVGYLFDRVNANDHRCFVAALIVLDLPLIDHEYLWSGLAQIGNTYGQGEDAIHLPRAPKPKAPPRQTALLVDDGKSAATTRLSGGRFLAPERVRAAIVGSNAGSFSSTQQRAPLDTPVVIARAAEMTGADLLLTFPTLSDVCGQPNAKGATGATKTRPCSKLLVWQEPDSWLVESGTLRRMPISPSENEMQIRGGFLETEYPITLKRPEPADAKAGPKPEFFTTALSSIAPAGAEATLRGIIPLPLNGSAVAIAVTGGELIGAAFTDAALKGYSVRLENGVATVRRANAEGPQAVAIELTLRNLLPGEKLVFTATATAAGKPTGTSSRSVAIKSASTASKPAAK